jgi:hypothetical protein
MTGTTGISPFSMALTRPIEPEGRSTRWGPKMPASGPLAFGLLCA